MPRFEIKAFIMVDAESEGEALGLCEAVADDAERTAVALGCNAGVACDDPGSLEEVEAD